MSGNGNDDGGGGEGAAAGGGGDSSPASSASFATKLRRCCCSLDRYQVETLIRVGAAVLIGCILSIAEIPAVIPPANNYLVGILAGVLALSLPKLHFTVPSTFPIILVAFVIAFALASALLAAATISNGLMVVVFAVTILIVNSIFFGERFDAGAPLPSMFAAIPGMLALSLRTLVQDGFNIPLPSDIVNGTNQQVLSSVLPVNIILPPTAGPIFAGKNATISFNDDASGLQATVDGGLWIVAAIWKQQGTTNSLAVFRNFMICACWGLAVVSLIIYAGPPFRTFRAFICKSTADAILQVAEILEDVATSSPSDDSQQEERARLRDRQTLLIELWNKVQPSDAGKLGFEPRLCRHPFEYIVPQMKQLLHSVEEMVLACLYFISAEDDSELGIEGQNVVRTDCRESAALLRAVAGSLAEGNSLEGEDSIISSSPSVAISSSPHTYVRLTNVIKYFALQVFKAAKEWNEAFRAKSPQHPTIKEKIQNLCKTYIPWLVMAIAPIYLIVTSVKDKRVWRPRSLLWSLKWTAGFVALYCMSLYWEGYANFAIDVDNVPIGSVFKGWSLLA